MAHVVSLGVVKRLQINVGIDDVEPADVDDVVYS